ncbi:hypothetical protein BGZ57DRAFT_917816 [Hyaloscypha finlandica]|nr:hypothetical protein BGZ57DRAFT_917816 [Hyaloscypha finlandica]
MGDRDHSFDSFQDDVDDDSHSLLEKFQPLRNRKQFGFLHGRCGHFLFIQFTLIILYTAMFLLLVDLFIDRQSVKKDLVYSPAEDVVNYERVRFNATLVIDSPYNGEPSLEVDEAWTELLQYMNIKVSKSDLDRIHADSIGVPGTDMYVGGLGVYHELHCLKRIRQYTWQDYYHAHATDEDKRLNRLHTDHCIDVLRQAILCHADVSLFTLEWSQDMPMPRADFSHEHTCKDWRRIFEWAGQRSIPEEKMKSLQHPIYGSAFPDGRGSVLGASEDHSAKIHE